ncbi:unnamed protein product [Tetraodon nigroviridis]|uniref:(spotted green pufferfish) hypothetical protein n=1 Tax=Tetraodon nigroviridis TaxID=99883 RepID=Q4RSL3_TETNG|nr:unnamed protein product [Tetraodon nigroviridis]
MSKAGSLHQLRGNQSENNTGEESTGCKEGPADRGREESAQGLVPGTPRHFGQEEMRLQKVYQVSIFSPPRGISTPAESFPDTQKPVRLGVKRGLEEPQWPAAKRPSLGDSSDEEALEGEVLCGPAPAQGVTISPESLSDMQRPVRLGVKVGVEESQWPATKRPCLGDSPEKHLLEGEVLCGSAPAQGMGLAMGLGGPSSVYSCVQAEQRDSDGGPLSRSPPLSPIHNPSRRPLSTITTGHSLMRLHPCHLNLFQHATHQVITS